MMHTEKLYIKIDLLGSLDEIRMLKSKLSELRGLRVVRSMRVGRVKE